MTTKNDPKSLSQDQVNYALSQESPVNLVNLRDKIAIEAMRSLISTESESQIADRSYSIADAMLARRQKP